MNFSFRTISVVFILSLLLYSCDEAVTEVSCLAGEPRPIFKESEDQVVAHQFKADAQKSEEQVRFENGEKLAILQSGCDTLIQTFQLLVSDSIKNWSQFKPLAVARFNRYANFDPKYYSFSQYARAIELIPDEYAMSRPANLAPGLIVRFFKLPTNEGNAWQIQYFQDLTAVQSPN